MIAGRWAAATALALAALAAADELTHEYEPGERVTVWLTRAGPYHNPQETYSYYALPFCAPMDALEPKHRFAGVGEVLEGTEWVNSDLMVRFGVDQPPTPYCSMTLDEASARFLDFAVANHYVYQLSIDDLPVWGLVGELVSGEEALAHLREHGESIDDEARRLGTSEHVHAVSQAEADAVADKAFVFTHRRLSLGYSGGRIVEANLTLDAPEHIEPGRAFDLTYSVRWVESSRPFESRFARYLETHLFEHHVHWFALVNSFLVALCAAGLVALVLGRTVYVQLAAVLREEAGDDAAAAADDAAWKLLHADVHRTPPAAELLAALLGTGVQLACMGVVVVAVSAVKALQPDRGFAGPAVIAAYALTSFAAGFVSGSWYRRQFLPRPSPRWQFVMFLTSAILPGSAAALLGPANVVAWRASTINAVGLGSLATLALVWVAVSLPLVVLGTIVGRRVAAPPPAGAAAPARAPRVNPLPRPLPETLPWYAHPAALVALAGPAPFACVFVEAFYVLSSFWGYKPYFLYGFLGLVIAMLGVVAACATVVAVYVALSHENHRWQWLAFLSGGSVSGYLFLYSVYYLVAKTQMHGLVQITFFFAYSALICLSIAIACGAIGFFAAQAFVRSLYANLKAE